MPIGIKVRKHILGKNMGSFTHTLKDLYTELSNNPEFAQSFHADPKNTLIKYGFDLSPEDLNMILNHSRNLLDKDQDLDKRENK